MSTGHIQTLLSRWHDRTRRRASRYRGCPTEPANANPRHQWNDLLVRAATNTRYSSKVHKMGINLAITLLYYVLQAAGPTKIPRNTSPRYLKYFCWWNATIRNLFKANNFCWQGEGYFRQRYEACQIFAYLISRGKLHQPTKDCGSGVPW